MHFAVVHHVFFFIRTGHVKGVKRSNMSHHKGQISNNVKLPNYRCQHLVLVLINMQKWTYPRWSSSSDLQFIGALRPSKFQTTSNGKTNGAKMLALGKGQSKLSRWPLRRFILSGIKMQRENVVSTVTQCISTYVGGQRSKMSYSNNILIAKLPVPMLVLINMQNYPRGSVFVHPHWGPLLMAWSQRSIRSFDLLEKKKQRQGLCHRDDTAISSFYFCLFYFFICPDIFDFRFFFPPKMKNLVLR